MAVKAGNDRGGVSVPVFETIDIHRDTEGSDWINYPRGCSGRRAVNYRVWGGTCDLAPALVKGSNVSVKHRSRCFC
ncbi:MAG: hypothetical protein M2R45_04583 [Verrucomicrobia subdivision 3 bacterium]|nr:hypothetical protein [Limisphaerales bacterium]MCS1417358.1 hypothetical protein [Limisphaerales bacterium]